MTRLLPVISAFFKQYTNQKLTNVEVRKKLNEIINLSDYEEVSDFKYPGKIFRIKNIKQEEADVKNARAVIPALKEGFNSYMLPKSKEYGIKSADAILQKNKIIFLTEIKVVTGKNRFTLKARIQ